jgi:hypothetical protein
MSVIHDILLIEPLWMVGRGIISNIVYHHVNGDTFGGRLPERLKERLFGNTVESDAQKAQWRCFYENTGLLAKAEAYQDIGNGISSLSDMGEVFWEAMDGDLV